MLVIERVLDTHHLELPEKGRRYVFRPLEEEVEVERWEDGKCTRRERMTYGAARRRYTYLRLHGYTKW